MKNNRTLVNSPLSFRTAVSKYVLSRLLLLLSILFIGCQPSSSSAEGFFEAIFGPSPIKFDCNPSDRVCLLDKAVELHLLRFRLRRVESNVFPHAQEGRRLLALSTSDSKRAAYLEKYRALGSTEEFYKELEANDDPGASWITPELVRQDFKDRHSSIKGDFNYYTRYALETLFKNHPEEAADIWWTHLKMLWEVNIDAVATGYDWALQNDLELLKRFHKKYYVPQTSYSDMFEVIPYRAARHCEHGDKETGLAILSLLEDELAHKRKTANLDKGRYVIDAAGRVEAVLYCKGKAAAYEALDEVLALTNRALKNIPKFNPTENERNFVRGVIQSEVGEGANVPMALWLHENGNTDEAIEVWSRLPFAGSQFSFEVTNSGKVNGDMSVMAMEAARHSFERLVETTRDDDLHSEDPKIALHWFLNSFPEKRIQGFRFGSVLKYVPDKIMAAWPEPYAVSAAEKLLSFTKKALSSEIIAPYKLHVLELKLATIEKSKSGCILSNQRLQSWLDNINQYPDMVDSNGLEAAYPGDYHQSIALETYLTYLRTPMGDGSGPCLME